jgi:hypothetical protein
MFPPPATGRAPLFKSFHHHLSPSILLRIEEGRSAAEDAAKTADNSK